MLRGDVLFFFEKALFSSFFIRSLLLWEISFLSVLYILVINLLSEFLPFHGMALQSGDHFFCCEKTF
jgi:hypothetical protein